ncbi:tryptophan 7-halogenase [Endozoicomonas sp. G2_1]|uniref:tryptophan halogenase family protein n=1 Tax=Endozoicomonas sp. G2_1 TaxID=2821091 RepID=UPI001ADBC355|nr:tryptophan halogenase family protein [Endozoicomonas sp. G2_1]MBO9489327.1 tryptophan 7-halogenase [Endozoicomonas sp. G2_1]
MSEPFKIAILGGGTAGWMAANLFAHKWRHRSVEINLVESPDIGIIGVGEGSTPTLKRFFDTLGIAESDWMPACDATYKVSIRFRDWSPASGIESYSHPFISQVDKFTERAFAVNCRTRRLGLDTHTRPEDFLLNGVLANQNKGPVAPENFPFSQGYGYHFNSHLLGQFLADYAIGKGVKHTQAKISSVDTARDGSVAALLTEQGERIEADFFVDCTGFASVLMQKTLGVEFTPFKDNLFNNAAVVLPTQITEDIPVETVSTALSNGWCWQIPLTSRFGNGYVYSSDFIEPEQAEHELRAHLGLLASPESARHLKMRVGQLTKHWHKNCLALGLAQGFIEPLEATALHLVQISIELFISQFERGNFSHQYQDEFNQKICERFERVRDYIVAHYKLNTRNDSDYWRANRDNNYLSESLLKLLDTWYRREDLTAEIERQQISTHFDSTSWHCLLAGYGAFPPLAPNQPGQGDLYRDQKVARFLNGCSLNFASHGDNLAMLRKAE